MLTAGLCIAGLILVVFVFVCMLFHSAKMTEIEMIKSKEREWMRKAIKNEK